MFGSKFSPRLESLDARLCLSATGGEVMAVDMFKPGEDRAALVDYFHTGDEKGAAVDRELLPAVKVESGWDVKPAEDRAALVDYFHPTDQLGGPYVGDSGWDKQT